MIEVPNRLSMADEGKHQYLIEAFEPRVLMHCPVTVDTC